MECRGQDRAYWRNSQSKGWLKKHQWKMVCTKHPALDTNNTNYKDREALPQLRMDLETVMHASGEKESLVNTWEKKDISEIMCGHCNREVHESQQTCGASGQSGKREDKLHCYDHSLEFMKAKPD
jgi:hypothetical protein